MDSNDFQEFLEEPCNMCGEPIGDQDWLFDDRSVWPDEAHREDVLIHERCAG